MKKLLALISMITCILGLTACGSEKVYTEYESQKVAYAKQLSTDTVIPMLQGLIDNEKGIHVLDDFTAEEVAYQMGSSYSINVDGYAVINGASSFESGLKEIGAISEVGTADATIDEHQIIVHVPIKGEKKDAELEAIFSNDMFMRLKSVALNPKASMGELMTNAALNTLIGMGTVFLVLIIISLVISAFKVIPSIQAKFVKKAEPEKKEEVSAPAAPPVVEEEEEDDLELVAVIAAAIAASEGAVTTDGFVVRSIRKINRR